MNLSILHVNKAPSILKGILRIWKYQISFDKTDKWTVGYMPAHVFRQVSRVKSSDFFNTKPPRNTNMETLSTQFRETYKRKRKIIILSTLPYFGIITFYFYSFVTFWKKFSFLCVHFLVQWPWKLVKKLTEYVKSVHTCLYKGKLARLFI